MGLEIDLPAIARACGYRNVYSVSTLEDLERVCRPQTRIDGRWPSDGTPAPEGPVFIEIKVRKGNRPDLGRPTRTPSQNRDAFMGFLKSK